MALPQIQYINMRGAVGGGASQPSALDELQQQLPHLHGDVNTLVRLVHAVRLHGRRAFAVGSALRKIYFLNEKRFGMSFVKRVVGEIERQRALADCEIRDFEAFSSLVPPSLQAAVLEAIRAGSVPPSLQPLFRRLRDAGVLVCL
jgi:hypothetical protein